MFPVDFPLNQSIEPQVELQQVGQPGRQRRGLQGLQAPGAEAWDNPGAVRGFGEAALVRASHGEGACASGWDDRPKMDQFENSLNK